MCGTCKSMGIKKIMTYFWHVCRLVREPLFEPNFLCFFFFFFFFVLIIASGPRVKFVDSEISLNHQMVCVTDRSKAVVLVLFLFCVVW